MSASKSPRMIGASVKRKEDPRLILGEGKYTDDVQLNGMVNMAVLRSPHPHARILRVDASKALSHPEVLMVLTGPEAKDHLKGEFPLAGVREGMRTKSRWPLAIEVARYVGEPVAVVAATSSSAARDALDLIDVDYRPLTPVMDMEEAAEARSPLVHDELGTNVGVDASRTGGDPDGAFRKADGVVSLRVSQPRLIPNPMEPRAVIASYERGTGNMTMWLSTQGPHLEREIISQVLGFPEHKLRIISIDVGGGFGCKVDSYSEAVIAPMLAMLLNQPVKWAEDRQEHFLSTIHGRGEAQYLDAAYRNDGTLTGLRIRYITDLGAYCLGGSHAIIENLTPSGVQGAYKVKDLSTSTLGIYTNKVPVGPYRGYGQHASSHSLERAMDLIARELNLDPVEVRRRNFISPEAFPYRTPIGGHYDSGDYGAALDKALNIASYDTLREQQEQLREQGELMGIGIATTVDASGFGPASGFSARAGYETAIVRVDASALVTVITGSSPHGQGHETTFAQIAADQLGVPLTDVDVVWGDTAVIPQGSGTRASRSVVVGGSAIVLASQRVIEKATKIAAGLLQIDPEFVVLDGGSFFTEDVPDRQVTWQEVAKAAYGILSPPRGLERGLEATAYWEPSAYTYPFSANVAVVRIDKDTGEVTLASYVSVDDCGTVINPMVVDGQVHGGLAQGIGAALLEEAVWDDSGQLLTGSFMDYAMPTAEDFPMFTLDRTVTPSPHNPLGVKGMGESPTIAAVPAVVNAVVDALSPLGVTHVDIPLKPEKIWKILKDKGLTSKPNT